MLVEGVRTVLRLERVDLADNDASVLEAVSDGLSDVGGNHRHKRVDGAQLFELAMNDEEALTGRGQ